MTRTTTRIVGPTALAFLCAVSVSVSGRQADPSKQGTMAEAVFKDVRVLKGTTAKEFMDTMGLFASSLNANCTSCHVEEAGGDWSRYADDHPNKRKAREMVQMVAAINSTYFSGRRVLTCYSCHRFGNRPKVIPTIAELYGVPADEDPDEVLRQDPGAPSADQVLDKYVLALGGAQRLAAITSLAGSGEYKAFDDAQTYPFDLYARAPNQRAVVMHSARGDRAMVFDGRTAWDAVPDTDRPFDLVLALDGDDLNAARLEAELSFPVRIKGTLTGWRVGPVIELDGRDVRVVQGTNAAGAPVKLYFEEQSGLLVRTLRYTNLRLGRIPTEIDYGDYREVAGVKFPFHWRIRWTDGELTFDAKEIRPNVPIDSAAFTRPPVPEAPPTR